jgi:hypothetical protein
MPLTEDEIKVLEQSGDLWNSFLELPIMHPDDRHEFSLHIHAVQNMLLSRSAYREMKLIEETLNYCANKSFKAL